MDQNPFALHALKKKKYQEILSKTGNGQKRLLGVLSFESEYCLVAQELSDSIHLWLFFVDLATLQLLSGG